MRCACAVLSTLACTALQYFYTLSHKEHDFGKKKMSLNIKCVLGSPKRLSETFRIQRTTEGRMTKNVHWCSRRVPFVLVRF